MCFNVLHIPLLIPTISPKRSIITILDKSKYSHLQQIVFLGHFAFLNSKPKLVVLTISIVLCDPSEVRI